jgi:hypothetical protein
MARAKQSSQPKRASKAVPVLGAAGLSLSLASGAYGASGAPAADMLSSNTAVAQEIALGEEAIFDVSLATFHVFDKKQLGPSGAASGSSPLVVPVASSRVWEGKQVLRARPRPQAMPIRFRRPVPPGP